MSYFTACESDCEACFPVNGCLSVWIVVLRFIGLGQEETGTDRERERTA